MALDFTDQQPPRPPGGVGPRSVNAILWRGAGYVVLALTALTMMLPFLWMVSTSLKPLSEVQSGHFLPQEWRPENYLEVITKVPFGRYYFNSVFVALWVTFGQVLTSALAAYAFSRLRWAWRDRVFLLYLGTLMVPGLVTLIPNYWVLTELRLINTYTVLILPACFSAYGTFLLRQFMLTIPASLDESAEIDGASHWCIFWDIVMPLARPGLVVLAIFTFMGNYQSFFWPLVMVKDEYLRTLPIGLLFFDSSYGRETTLLMAASVMAMLPLIALFVVGQRFFVRGIQLGAVKG
ncbi:MAG: carbohydrate ABC transporter permease [Armatimonadetes bacterium]|nr:carbohydrate ABC transporter permease [Armatimonadota bacterium]